jgi:hypothetical protein
MVKHQQQRHDDQNRAHERERLHERVLEFAPVVVGGDHFFKPPMNMNFLTTRILVLIRVYFCSFSAGFNAAV